MLMKRFFSTSTMTKSPRHFVNTIQLSNTELASLVSKAANFKKQVRSGNPTPVEAHNKLLGKLVAMLFTKRSTRTRISTEGAAAYFGAQPMFLGKDDIQLGVNEAMYDTTKVISSMTSCIFARVDTHQTIVDLCKDLSVPIINSLCDMYHPLQAVADILTIKEAFGKTEGLKLAWIGDSNNVINDLAISALKSGISVSISIPESITFSDYIISEANKLVAANKSLTFEIVHDPLQAVKDSNIIVTDTWISMGQEAEKIQKLQQFDGYQIDLKMLSEGKAAADWKFMHCLPRHAEEVADDVFYHDNSLVFEEAENRLYAAMAVIDGFVINKGNLE